MTDRVLYRGISAGVLSTVVSSIANLISQPIMLGYYGSDVYAEWVIVSTYSIYFGLSNLGIPTSLLVLANAEKTQQDKYSYITNGFLLLSLLSFVFVGILQFTNIAYILLTNYISPDKSSLLFSSLLTISLTTTALKLPTQSLLAGFNVFQNQFPAKIIEACYAVVVLIAALSSKLLDLSLEYSLYLVLFLNIPIQLSVAWCFRSFIKSSLIILLKLINPAIMSRLIRNGLGFLLLGLPVTISLTIDNIFIEQSASLSDVTLYSFINKIFMYPYLFLNIFAMSMFSMVGHECSKRNFQWVNSKVSIGSNFLSILNGGFILIIFIFGNKLLYLWTQNQSIFIKGEQSIFFALYVFTLPLVNITSCLLTGLNSKSKVMLLAYLELIVHICISIIFIPYFGISAVAAALFVSSFLVPYILLPAIINKKYEWIDRSIARTNYRMFFFCFTPALILAHLLNIFYQPSSFVGLGLTLMASILAYALMTYKVTKSQYWFVNALTYAKNTINALS